jgi:hypothetical protein
MASGRPSADLVAWRAERLMAHGFGRVLAQAVAADGHVDLHAAIELVERGCPPHLAARILAPLDGPDEVCGGGR